MHTMNNIAISKKFVEGLIKAYDKAKREGAAEFTYNGHEFMTSYAKYFIEYYAPKFNIKP